MEFKKVKDADLKAGLSTVLIDFDGVLRHWVVEDVHQGELNLGIPPGSLHKLAFDKEFLLPAITGKVTHSQWMLEVCTRIQKTFDQVSIERINAFWTEAKWIIDNTLIPQLQSILPDSRLVLASNATSKLN